jgi:uncharacterized repeat protein (TIGR01451 family)
VGALALLGAGPARAEPPVDEASHAITAQAQVVQHHARVLTATEASADLAIFSYADDPVANGEVFSLYVDVESFGPDPATGVTFTDTLPAGTTFQSVGDHSTGVACSHATGVVTCTATSILVDADVFVELLVLAPSVDGTITNHVQITAQTPPDPSPEDNAYDRDIVVSSDADVFVFQSASNVALNANAVFNVFLGNSGPKAATNVTLTVHMPEQTAYVSHVAPAGMTCSAPVGHTLTCTVASLPRTSDEDDPPMLTVTVGGLAAAGVLTSTVEASAASPADPYLDNNDDAEVAVVGSPPLADLYVFGDFDVAVVGMQIVLSSEVYNDGPQTATNVQFTDTLPSELTFVSATVQGGAACTAPAGVVTCALGSIAAEDSKIVQMTVMPTATGEFSHLVKASAASPADPDPDGNEERDFVQVYPAGSTDLSLFGIAGPDQLVPGSPGRYSFIAENDGPSSVSGATFEGTLPAGVDYVGATTPAGVSCSFDNGTGKVTCTLGTLAADDTRTFDVILQRTTVGPLDVTFTVPYGLDIFPEDNEAEVTSSVVAAGTASLTALAWNQSSFTPLGIPMRYRFGATNHGPSTATGVTVTIPLPASVTYVSASSPGGTCNVPSGGVLTCTLPAIAPGDVRTMSLVVTPNSLGPLSVAGTIAFAGDPSTSDNAITVPATIVAAVIGAPGAAMAGAQIVTDPATGEILVAASYDALATLTLSGTAQCPGGGPIGTNPVAFAHLGVSHAATASGGRYQATFSAFDIDDARFYGLVQCGGVTTQNRLGDVEPYFPLGRVTDLVTGNPVAGASVTLFRVPGWFPRRGAYQNAVAGSCESGESKPEGAPWSQPAPTADGVTVDDHSGLIRPAVNPGLTNTSGDYGWLLDVEGCWYVTVSRAGYLPLTSPVVGLTFDGLPDGLDLKLDPILHAVTVTSATPTLGTVTSSPAGIACPGTCSKTFQQGSSVTLTAHPNAGLVTQWGGACAAAAGNACTLSVTGALAISVSFVPIPTPPPPPPPPPPPDTTKPALHLTVAGTAKRRAAVLRTGLVVSVRASEACTATLELRLTAATARRLKLPVVIGSARKTIAAAGTVRVTIRLKTVARRKLAKLASLRATLVATAKDPAGNTGKTSALVVIRR